MPTYEYRCQSGHEFERVLPVADYKTPQTCECGKPSRRILSLPSVYVRPDIRYTSPIDERPITSKQQRIEDLKRHDCVEYDPEMKTDYNRRVAEREAELDKSVEQTVEAAVEKMDVLARAIWRLWHAYGLSAYRHADHEEI